MWCKDTTHEANQKELLQEVAKAWDLSYDYGGLYETDEIRISLIGGDKWEISIRLSPNLKNRINSFQEFMLGEGIRDKSFTRACKRLIALARVREGRRETSAESWTQWVLMPREYAELFWEKLDNDDDDDICEIAEAASQMSSYDRGPGRAFADEPWAKKITKKWVLVTQDGGLDI